MRRVGPSGDLLLLLAIAALAQWKICRGAVTPALDAVRYVSHAQWIEREGFASLLRATEDQPLYAWCVALARGALASRDETAWLSAAQFVAASALVFAIIPLYVLLARWLGRARAILGCLIFTLLPETARLGADALADSLSLFLALSALALFVAPLAWRREQVCLGESGRDARFALWLFTGGIATGLSILTCTLALPLLPAFGLFTLTTRNLAPLRDRLRYIGVSGLGTVVVVLPYLVASGVDSTDSIVARVLGSHQARSAALVNHERTGAPVTNQIQWLATSGERLDFTREDPETARRATGVSVAARDFAAKLGQTAHYWLGIVAAFGAWKMRRAANCFPGRFLFLLALLNALVVFAYSSRVGYLSSRHLALLVPILAGWSSQGIWSFAGLASRHALRLVTPLARPHRMLPAFASALLLPVLPATWLPVHAHRAGPRSAGEWLAEHSPRGAAVFDTTGLTALYSGRRTFRAEAGEQAMSDPDLAYVVIESRDLESQSRRAKTLRDILAASGELLGSFASTPDEVTLVYAWRSDRFVRHFTRKTQKFARKG